MDIQPVGVPRTTAQEVKPEVRLSNIQQRINELSDNIKKMNEESNPLQASKIKAEKDIEAVNGSLTGRITHWLESHKDNRIARFFLNIFFINVIDRKENLQKIVNDLSKQISREQGVLANQKTHLETQKAVYDLFGGEEEYNKLPEISREQFYKIREERFHRGQTGYIDYILAKDFGQNRIVRGVDEFGRPFFSIRGEDDSVQTFFKRYSDHDAWSDAGSSLIHLEDSWAWGGQVRPRGEAVKQLIERTKELGFLGRIGGA